MTVRQQSSPAGLGNEPCTELLASVPCSWGWCPQGFPGSCCRQAAVLARELLQDELFVQGCSSREWDSAARPCLGISHFHFHSAQVCPGFL